MIFKKHNPGCTNGTNCSCAGGPGTECNFCNSGETIDELTIDLSTLNDEDCTGTECVGLEASYVLSQVSSCKWEWNGSGGRLWDGSCSSSNLKIEAWMETPPSFPINLAWTLRVRFTNLNGSDSEWAEFEITPSLADSADDCCDYLSTPRTLTYTTRGVTGLATGYACDFPNALVTAECTTVLVA